MRGGQTILPLKYKIKNVGKSTANNLLIFTGAIPIWYKNVGDTRIEIKQKASDPAIIDTSITNFDSGTKLICEQLEKIDTSEQIIDGKKFSIFGNSIFPNEEFPDFTFHINDASEKQLFIKPAEATSYNIDVIFCIKYQGSRGEKYSTRSLYLISGIETLVPQWNTYLDPDKEMIPENELILRMEGRYSD